MGASVVEALGDPSESLIDAYVAAALIPVLSLDALMALLCARPLLVRVLLRPSNPAWLF